MIDELTLPAAIVAAPCRDRKLAIVRTTTAIVERDDHYLQRSACDGAFVHIEHGIVPVLIEHAARWNIENSVGTIREARFADATIEMVAEFGSNPKGEWIWRDLRDGFTFACSVGLGLFNWREVATELPKPLRLTESWVIRELTLCAPGGGADDQATVKFAHTVDELLVELQAEREARDELRGRALPSCYADPLRLRLGDMADSIAHAIGADDADQLRVALAAEVEHWIGNWRGSQ